jgi:hypothetical protein
MSGKQTRNRGRYIGADSIFIPGIPPELLKQFMACCRSRGLTMKETIISLMKETVRKQARGEKEERLRDDRSNQPPHALELDLQMVQEESPVENTPSEVEESPSMPPEQQRAMRKGTEVSQAQMLQLLLCEQLKKEKGSETEVGESQPANTVGSSLPISPAAVNMAAFLLGAGERIEQFFHGNEKRSTPNKQLLLTILDRTLFPAVADTEPRGSRRRRLELWRTALDSCDGTPEALYAALAACDPALAKSRDGPKAKTAIHSWWASNQG